VSSSRVPCPRIEPGQLASDAIATTQPPAPLTYLVSAEVTLQRKSRIFQYVLLISEKTVQHIKTTLIDSYINTKVGMAFKRHQN